MLTHIPVHDCDLHYFLYSCFYQLTHLRCCPSMLDLAHPWVGHRRGFLVTQGVFHRSTQVQDIVVISICHIVIVALSSLKLVEVKVYSYKIMNKKY